MKCLAIPTLAIALLVGPHAIAQTIVVAPEQRTVIKEYVVREKVPAVAMRERISVGARLPTDIELHAVPTQWGPSYSKYRYVYSGSDVYLVEPSTREVVTIVD